MLEMLESMDRDVIKKIILKGIPDATCSFDGDSCNFKLVVTSASFKEISLIQQHKRVLNLLKDNFQSGSLHALSLDTKVG